MFKKLTVGGTYTRPELARLWGYASYHAIARGVVTPAGTNSIILFVTEQKQDFQHQYRDRLLGGTLSWEGPTDHFAEERMLNAARTADETHLFWRERHHSAFTYKGRLIVLSCKRRSDKPSSFTFELKQ